MAAAALESFVTQGLFDWFDCEITKRRQQKCSEPAFLRRDGPQILASNDAGEKALSEVLGVMRRMTLSSKIGVERCPISATEFLQRLAARWSRPVARVEDSTPVSGGKERGTVAALAQFTRFAHRGRDYPCYLASKQGWEKACTRRR